MLPDTEVGALKIPVRVTGKFDFHQSWCHISPRLHPQAFCRCFSREPSLWMEAAAALRFSVPRSLLSFMLVSCLGLLSGRGSSLELPPALQRGERALQSTERKREKGLGLGSGSSHSARAPRMSTSTVR